MRFKIAFPLIMIAIMLATLARYGTIQDYRRRSSDYRLVVESTDIESLERAIRGATFQEVDSERIDDDRYVIVVKCPPEKIGYIMGVIQKMGARRSED